MSWLPKRRRQQPDVLTCRIVEDDVELLPEVTPRGDLHLLTIARVEMDWRTKIMQDKQLVATWRDDEIIDVQLVTRGHPDGVPLTRDTSIYIYSALDVAWKCRNSA